MRRWNGSIGNEGEHWHKFGWALVVKAEGKIRTDVRSWFHINLIQISTLYEVLTNGSTPSICEFVL